MRRTNSLIALLLIASSVWACAEDKTWVSAKQIESYNEMIGGPSAKGKLGDYLIENDQIRAIIGGTGPAFAAGVFGGTLLDIDRYRWRSDERGAQGHDAFSDAFPLANLLVVNPADPRWSLKLSDEAFTMERSVSAVQIIKDGSDGEAIIRVSGHSAYMFHVLKFLNIDFLESFLGEGIAGLSLPQLVNLGKTILGVDLLGLLNRLQISFDISTDYVLRPGESYLTMRTTVVLSPPSETRLKGCPLVACEKDCEHGYAVAEMMLELDSLDGAVGSKMCPVCECAEASPEMPTFNESRDFFQVILGTPADWENPNWRAGVVAGDFLFYGGECDIFTPGIGFDYDTKIFNNMWQRVGTMGSPFAVPFVTGIADNVSYTWTATNPRKRDLLACPSYRLAITGFDPADEDELVSILVDELGFVQGVAASAVRVAIVDHKPIFLGHSFASGADVADGGQDARQQVFDAWRAEILAGDEVKTFRQTLSVDVTLDLVAQHDCLDAKMLVPLFTTSATAVLSHFSEGDGLTDDADGNRVDKTRSYTYERFLVVGDGDVGSTLQDVYELRNSAYGWLTGVVVEEGSGRPVHHAGVFVLRDPRVDASEAAPKTYQEYIKLAQARFGEPGVLAFIQTDVGTDPVHDGDYRSALLPGTYFVFANEDERGMSPLVEVTITADSTSRVNFVLTPAGHISYLITDEGGETIPSRMTFIELDEDGERLPWEASSVPVLGDAHRDHGIVHLEHAHRGKGRITLPAGRYDIVVSRGFEYSIAELHDVEVLAGQDIPIEATLIHEVDTRGYISGDFHIHQSPSSDAGLPLDIRIKAAAAEGVEFISSSDHDHLTDYDPMVRELGLERYLKTQVGSETSPLEFGHFNGFPLKYDDSDGNMHDPPPWAGRVLSEVFQEMRDRASDPDDFVLQANHPRDGFLGLYSQIGLKGYSMERATPGMEMCNPVIEEVPCNFDAFELMNGKHIEYLWTPTIGEMKNHNLCYREMVDERDLTKFSYASNGSDAICGWLQETPAACAKAADLLAAASTDDEIADAHRLVDHCGWYKLLQDATSRCDEPGMSLVDCKRASMEGLKELSIRFMGERTKVELAAYAATTTETDLGCDFEKAFTGCSAEPDEDGAYAKGCGGAEDCFCEACVCAEGAHPECCESVDDGGTGWTPECAAACSAECHGCGVQPCTDRFQMVDDWFALMNLGYDIAPVGNSDSHGTLNEVGLPRTYVQANSDRPANVKASVVNRNLKAGKSIISAGPFIDFSLLAGDASASVGETLAASDGQSLSARLRVQTPSWFSVDRVEIYRNGLQEWVTFLGHGADGDPAGGIQDESLVDFDEVIPLTRPTEDSWYVAIAYGSKAADQMSPVYKRRPYGHILFTTVIALGADSLLASFSGLLEKLPAGILDIESLLGSLEMPDSFPVIPYALTAAIKVDIDGSGFWPIHATDTNNDDLPDLPAFCSQGCEVAMTAEGDFGPSTCGLNQTCVPDEAEALGGTCKIPIPAACVGLQPIGGMETETETAQGALSSGPQIPAAWDRAINGGLLQILMNPHRR